ncbi:MAG: V-type ATP synthase subunit E [Clostridia bacterium]|nr:V-type ATP synthase subunit E [Clostridia bacterium]
MKEQKIIAKIISDAEEKALATVAGAERRAENIIAEARAAAARSREEQLALLSARHAETLRRREINARLDCNKLTLSARREVIDAVFDGALQKLCALPEAEYAAFIGKLLSKHAEGGETVVLSFRCGCREKIAALPVIKEKNLTVSKEYGKFSGGAVLVGGGYDKNLTFEALIESAREEKQAEVVAALFG